MGKQYWISVLEVSLDRIVSDLEKELEPQIAELQAQKAEEFLASHGEQAIAYRDEWVALNKDIEEVEAHLKELRKLAGRVKDRFYAEVDHQPYYSSTSPVEYIRNEVRQSARETVTSESPQGEEIRRLKILRPKIASTIERATTDKRVNEAVEALAKAIGVELDY